MKTVTIGYPKKEQHLNHKVAQWQRVTLLAVLGESYHPAMAKKYIGPIRK